jgi:anti-sigma factor RsiW
LPWHVNGTLSPPEAALVTAHLAECSECRAALEAESALCDQVASLEVEVEDRWAAMRQRIEAGTARPKVERLSMFRRPVALGWMVAGQAAVAACAVLAFMAIPAAAPQPAYKLLGAPAEAASGNVILLFSPGTTERQLRETLEAAQGRIVDGPTASGAYVIHVPDAERAGALERLRAVPHVALAEPISGDGG